jgi:two-component system response regulator PilR (NtrC family)
MRTRALVVEDEAGTRDLLRQLLENEGFEVDVAVDGEKAIGFLANHDYDVVLMDMVLPRVSGADVMEHLLCTKPQVLEKIIVVTGVHLEDVRKLFPTVPRVLSKPVIPSRVLQLVRERVERGRRFSVA